MKGYDRYFRGQDLAFEGSEKHGWYTEGDRLVQRVKCFKLDIPKDAVFVKIFYDGTAMFTHPSFDEVRDGDEAPVATPVEEK